MVQNKKLIVGNWKMHGDAQMAQTLAGAVSAQTGKSTAITVICPPATLIAQVAYFLRNSTVKLGGQDCSPHSEGAYTGDISAAMIKSAGADYVIAGHSERRAQHDETSANVREKASASITAGLIPIICIGESDADRQAGKAEEVVGKQVRESIPEEAGEGNFILAYEPVWAIGSGKTPTASDIQAMHTYIVSQAASTTGLAPGQISVLYGGSVKAANAREILATQGVAGVLVGGASLNADEFCRIIASA